jgi:hypothetical protein
MHGFLLYRTKPHTETTPGAAATSLETGNSHKKGCKDKSQQLASVLPLAAAKIQAAHAQRARTARKRLPGDPV